MSLEPERVETVAIRRVAVRTLVFACIQRLEVARTVRESRASPLLEVRAGQRLERPDSPGAEGAGTYDQAATLALRPAD
jgi:hypothetical protein